MGGTRWIYVGLAFLMGAFCTFTAADQWGVDYRWFSVLAVGALAFLGVAVFGSYLIGRESIGKNRVRELLRPIPSRINSCVHFVQPP